jgi:hypothetical protein
MRSWRTWFSIGMLLWVGWLWLEAWSWWRRCTGMAGPWLADACGHPYRLALFKSLAPLAVVGFAAWLAPLWRLVVPRRGCPAVRSQG